MNAVAKQLVGLRDWIDARYPLIRTWNEHLGQYYAPKNFNFWYYFGVISIVVLTIQILTGIWLSMNYKPDADLAFGSVEYIMRDVQWGWLIRYLHSTGSSFFFIAIYLHMFRALMYGSYKNPRELIWLTGMVIYFLLMAEAFLGYLLPWGQLSYWGAQVITSLFGVIPVIGEDLALWLRDDYVISDVTLNRFYSLHVVAIPLAIIALVGVHIIALHEVGSNNPDGVEIKAKKDANGKPLDGIPFHPYYTVKDLVGITVFLIFFCIVVFFAPGMGGWFLEANNFVPANPLATPEHITALWYFTPFYAILKAVPSKPLGVIAMNGAIVLFFFLPWLDRSPIKSIRYRGSIYKIALALFAISFVALGFIGAKSPTPELVFMSRIFSIIYFGFFLLMPLYTWGEKGKPVPERVTGP